jgi:hypothetical protein
MKSDEEWTSTRALSNSHFRERDLLLRPSRNGCGNAAMMVGHSLHEPNGRTARVIQFFRGLTFSDATT